MYNCSASKISSPLDVGQIEDWPSLRTRSPYLQPPLQFPCRLPIHHVPLSFATNFSGLLQSSGGVGGGSGSDALTMSSPFQLENDLIASKSVRTMGPKTIRFGDKSIMDLSESFGIANQLHGVHGGGALPRGTTGLLSPPITPAQGTLHHQSAPVAAGGGGGRFVDSSSEYQKFVSNDSGVATSWTKDENGSSSSPLGGAAAAAAASASATAAVDHAMNQYQTNGFCGHPVSRPSYSHHYQHRLQQQQQHPFPAYLVDNGARQIADSNLDSGGYLGDGRCSVNIDID